MSQRERRGTASHSTTNKQNRDAFDNQVTQTTTNEADLASHYPYSPERYRLFVDGTRQFIQYDGEPAQFTDTVDSFTLTPQSDGEVVTFKTAEQFRYVVQYIIEWSLAFDISQPPQSGGVWAVGFGDPDLENSADDTPGPNADGWFVYQNSSHAAGEATLAEYRAGTEQDTRTIAFERLPETWGRLAGQTNWYNVGETSLEETYTETPGGENRQRNDRLGIVASDDGKGPETGNKQIHVSVKAGSGAPNFALDCGSIGVRTLGEVTGILRSKTFDFNLTYSGTTGEFEPLLAFRADPDRSQVNTQLAILEALSFGGDSNLVMVANAFDATNVFDTNGDALTDADFSTPTELNSTNSVIETSTAVEQVPDSSGTAQTSMTNPGGYQIGYASLQTTDAQGNQVRQSSEARTQKRIIPTGDIGVVMLRADATGTVEGDLQFEQDW